MMPATPSPEAVRRTAALRAAAAIGVVVLGGLLVWSLLPDTEAPPAVEPVVEAPPPEPLEPDRVILELRIRPGTTFGQLLADHGVDHHAVRRAALDLYDLANIRPDRELSLEWVSGDPEPVAVRYRIDEDRTVVVARDTAGWGARIDEVVYDHEVGVRDFSLTRSLWQDGLEAGLRPPDLVRLARIFEYELDFNSELRAGARLSLVADVLSAEGRRSRLGDIHAVRITNAGKTIEAVRHVDSSDEEAYFRPDGTGMKRPFLRSPLEFSRVTSGFNPKRFHPVLKRRRPHNGTDFGAPTGTPVRAVASGRVEYAGRNGGHGNFVKLDHEGPYETSYSHLSRILVRNGQTVRQGQIIGHVGSTGMSTGPHLHYQMWKNGRYVDPMKIEMPRTASIPASDRAAFAVKAAEWMALLPDEPAVAAEE